MPEDIIDVSIGGIFRLIKYIIKDILFDIACYIVGWFFLRLVTLGRYPDLGLAEGIREHGTSEFWAGITGLVIITAVAVLLLN